MALGLERKDVETVGVKNPLKTSSGGIPNSKAIAYILGIKWQDVSVNYDVLVIHQNTVTTIVDK